MVTNDDINIITSTPNLKSDKRTAYGPTIIHTLYVPTGKRWKIKYIDCHVGLSQTADISILLNVDGNSVVIDSQSGVGVLHYSPQTDINLDDNSSITGYFQYVTSGNSDIVILYEEEEDLGV